MENPKRTWRHYTADKLVNGFLSCCGSMRITPPPGCFAIDTHIHSLYSRCSVNSVEQIILRAAQIGLTGIAVMDHNDIRSAKAASECSDQLKQRNLIPETFIIIPGMEIGSGAGHIGALFVDEEIPKNLGMQGTVERIHEAGGLAVAVHPFLRSGIGDALFDAPFDAVEIESGSAFGHAPVEKAHHLLDDERMTNIAKLGSSDAHYIKAIGMCYTIIKSDEISIDTVKTQISQCLTVPQPSSVSLRIRIITGNMTVHK
ncbi:MAG: PHP domain-containing protein [Armatimonadota bacterium]